MKTIKLTLTLALTAAIASIPFHSPVSAQVKEYDPGTVMDSNDGPNDSMDAGSRLKGNKEGETLDTIAPPNGDAPAETRGGASYGRVKNADQPQVTIKDLCEDEHGRSPANCSVQ